MSVIVWTSLITLPIVLLVGIQVWFLPYQNELVTWWHRIVLVVDLWILWWIWQTFMSPRSASEAMERKSTKWFLLIWPNLFDQRTSNKTPSGGLGWHESRAIKWFGVAATMVVLIFCVAFATVRGGALDRGLQFGSWTPTWLPRTLALRDGTYVRDQKIPDVVKAYEARSGGSKAISPTLFAGLDLRGRNFRGADFTNAKMYNADFTDADLRSAQFYSSKLRGANFTGAQLDGAMFAWAHLQGAIFQRANLAGAVLAQARLHGADLSSAVMHGADLRSAHLLAADLSSAKLNGAELAEANLSGAMLRNADLRGAAILFAILEAVDLRGAKLGGADIRINSSMKLADLSGIKFGIRGIKSWAILRHAIEHRWDGKMYLDDTLKRLDQGKRRTTTKYYERTPPIPADLTKYSANFIIKFGLRENGRAIIPH